MFVIQAEELYQELGTPEPTMPLGACDGETIGRGYYSWVCLWLLRDRKGEAPYYQITDWHGRPIELECNRFEPGEGESDFETKMRAWTAFSRLKTRLMVKAQKFECPQHW